MAKTESHKRPPLPVTSDPVEIILHAPKVGTLFWFLPEDLADIFHSLPVRARANHQETATRRISHILLMVLGLIQHPELESRFGGRLDTTLAELADDLSELLENPPKPQ